VTVPGARPVVHLVEDDELSRRAAARLLTAAGHEVRTYESSAAFLARTPAAPGCLVLDLRLPGLSGLELQERLAADGAPLPIVFLTGHGEVRQSVQAMKAGAIDFLTKPVNGDDLLAAVARALSRDADQRAGLARHDEAQQRYERLTPREREVFAYVIGGALNKQTAAALGTTEHTVKVHRSRVMAKLGAGSVADLIRLADELHIVAARP
jgi:FixJ family two-component response regulator